MSKLDTTNGILDITDALEQDASLTSDRLHKMSPEEASVSGSKEIVIPLHSSTWETSERSLVGNQSPLFDAFDDDNSNAFEVNYQDVLGVVGGTLTSPKPVARQDSTRSRSESPMKSKPGHQMPGSAVRSASLSPTRRDSINETGEKTGVRLNPRKIVKYTTSDGKEKSRNMKRSHDDEFFWDKSVQPSNPATRKIYNRANLPSTVYNFSIDTHTSVAVVYIDPLNDTVYFAGTGECLDFISIPEDRRVIWKAPNHPQQAFLTRDFCRALPFNKFEKPKKQKNKRQVAPGWKISDLPVPPKQIHIEDNEEVDDPAMDDMELTPSVKKTRGRGANRGGRGGGRVGAPGVRGAASRGRGSSTVPSTSESLVPRGIRVCGGVRVRGGIRVRGGTAWAPPPSKESATNPEIIKACSLISEP